MYYTRKEQVLRTGAWACANGFGSMIGGIIAYGMGQANTGISSWKVGDQSGLESRSDG